MKPTWSVRIHTALNVCSLCGASIQQDDMKKHEDWHEKIEPIIEEYHT